MSKAEKFISDYTRNCSNLMQVPTLDDKGNIVPEAHPWLTPDDARKAVEIAREELELGWEDIEQIYFLVMVEANKLNKYKHDVKEMYQEVLKRFKDYKDGGKG